MLSRLVPVLALLSAAAPAGHLYEHDSAFPPHRIADHLYYVGSEGLAAYLITTSKGHILINAGFERTVPLIRKSVEQLGFKLSDVKILLASHAHDDHVEGMALLKRLTGADVYIMTGDAEVVATGGAGQYLYNSHWARCPVKRVLADGDTVTLGEVTLTAHLTPGHTRGCTTWTMPARDGDKTYAVVIVGSPNINPDYRLVDNAAYPEIASDYAQTFRVLESLPCDLFLGAHGSYYDMAAKYARFKSGAQNPFVDREGYRAYVAERKRTYLRTLQEQQAQAGAKKAPATEQKTSTP